MADFTRAAGGDVHMVLEGYETHLMRELLHELRGVLETQDRKDPVTARLFPPAYDEAGEAEAFRELIGDDLKSSKLSALSTVEARIGDSGSVRGPLPEDEIDAWLRTLTDLRLAIGTRLDVTEETMHREFDPEDPEAPALSMLHWLQWMQESLLEAVMGGS